VGIIVGRRVGKATIRNRVKRRIREVVRAAYPRLRPGYDVVLIARPAAVEASVPNLAAAFAALLERARLRKPPTSADDTQARGENATAAESGGEALGIQEPLKQ
jgi:ribonuclease P protein component